MNSSLLFIIIMIVSYLISIIIPYVNTTEEDDYYNRLYKQLMKDRFIKDAVTSAKVVMDSTTLSIERKIEYLNNLLENEKYQYNNNAQTFFRMSLERVLEQLDK